MVENQLTAAALRLARSWCEGHEIGGEPALAHALRVVDVLGRHAPDAPPDVVAAVLLHDSPDLVPAGVDLDATLTVLLSAEVARLVRALQHEHDGLDDGAVVAPPVNDPHLMLASAADKIVSVQAVLARADAADSSAANRAKRPGFIAALEYFRAFTHAGRDVLPESMTDELDRLVSNAEAIHG